MTGRGRVDGGNLSRLAGVFVLVLALLTQWNVPLVGDPGLARHLAAGMGAGIVSASDICHSGDGAPASVPTADHDHCLLCQVAQWGGVALPSLAGIPAFEPAARPFAKAPESLPPTPVAWLSPFPQGPPV